MFTQEYLKSILNYDYNTGVFTWNVCKARPISIGMEAGRINNDGYIGIGIDGKKYQAHRLAWYYVYGELPTCEVDHVNHDRLDNKIANLRLASATENQRNRAKNKNNTSGFCGVRKSTNCNSYTAQIGLNGSVIYLGSFKTMDEAIEVRSAANKEHSFHKNHGKDEQ